MVDTGDTDVSYQIINLTAGYTYQVRVAAVNSEGTGPYSAIETAIAQGAPDTPGAPGVRIDISADAAALTAMEIYWSEPNDNGNGISSYDLRYREEGTLTWTDVTDTSTTTYDATGLTLHDRYEIQVRATNSHGNSEFSDVEVVQFSPRWLYSVESSNPAMIFRWDEDSMVELSTETVVGASDMAALGTKLFLSSTSDHVLREVDPSTGSISVACTVASSAIIANSLDQVFGLTALGIPSTSTPPV